MLNNSVTDTKVYPNFNKMKYGFHCIKSEYFISDLFIKDIGVKTH